MTAEDRPNEYEQRGWNMGYIAGEADRITLATACCDLRSDLDNALRMIADLLARIDREGAK